jgi:hypothetical protein
MTYLINLQTLNTRDVYMKLNPVFELGMKVLEFVKMCQIDTKVTFF